MSLNLKTFLLPLALLPFLFDYYIFELKIFDIIAIGIAVFCIIFLKPVHLKPLLRSRVLLFILFFIFYGLVGLLVNEDIVGFLGLILGIIFFTLTCIYFNVKQINRYSYVLLIILVTTFIAQFLSSLILNNPLNYHAIIGETPRLETSLGFRSAGLYLEPTSFCAMMFMVISLRFLNNNFGRWEAIGILSIFFSASLYGFFVSLILFLMWVSNTAYFKKLLLYFGVFLALLFFIISTFSESILNPHLQFLLFERLPSIATDGSVIARYGLNQEASDITQLVFGSGLSTINPGARGSSGFSYLIGGVGFLGFFIFILLVVNLFRTRIFFIIPSIFVILMSSYYWTYSVFWMWLAWLYISVMAHPINAYFTPPQNTSSRRLQTCSQ